MANYIMKKVEEKVGIDLNGDGQVGGAGVTSQLEQATHVDLNRDGVIGYRPPADGGIVGKIERATHIDLNGDGFIGGRLANTVHINDNVPFFSEQISSNNYTSFKTELTRRKSICTFMAKSLNA